MNDKNKPAINQNIQAIPTNNNNVMTHVAPQQSSNTKPERPTFNASYSNNNTRVDNILINSIHDERDSK